MSYLGKSAGCILVFLVVSLLLFIGDGHLANNLDGSLCALEVKELTASLLAVLSWQRVFSHFRATL